MEYLIVYTAAVIVINWQSIFLYVCFYLIKFLVGTWFFLPLFPFLILCILEVIVLI